MSFNGTKIAVRWKVNGQNFEKIYATILEADRAKKWLHQQGISDVEQAVIIEEKIEEETEEI